MKQIIVIVLVLGLLAGLLVPFFNKEAIQEAATLQVSGNVQCKYGEIIPLKVKVPEGITKIQFIYNDKTLKTVANPKGFIQFKLESDYFGVGTREFIVRSFFSDGLQLEDKHFIRVVSDVVPELFAVKINTALPHNTNYYTQGLEFDGNQLYEGTGDPNQQGNTLVGKVNMTSYEMTTKNGLDASYFGEGITIFKDKLYQLTWQNGKCFVYDKNTMVVQKDFSYQGEGWGLCNDGEQLIMSDGTERIYFRNPETFQITRFIEVYDNVGPRTKINELEFVDGLIYANIYYTNTIIVIDPLNGKVVKEIDASNLETLGKNGGDVLNGIAFNKLNKKWFLTGKKWSKIFDVQFIPKV